ncbi:MAG: hypothetical protein NC191_03890 [Muribaculaceae bacterium]|nr:hypothetical protein [Muribaculaceae bacterium]
MFRDDRCSIERPVQIKEEGETIGWQDDLIAVDLPCHLSVQSISPVNQSQSTATVLLDYVLYIDTKHGVTIQSNDKITVTTAQGQQYQLRAGESHKYRLTTQTHCEILKVV